jgi:hypothetical protein
MRLEQGAIGIERDYYFLPSSVGNQPHELHDTINGEHNNSNRI